MEYRCKSGAIVALIILAPLSFSQVERIDVRPNKVRHPPVDSRGRELDPEKIRRAEALFNGARLASEKGDLKGAHSLLKDALRNRAVFEPSPRRNGEKITLPQTDLDRYRDTLYRASQLYFSVTPTLGEQIRQAGDTSGAEALNRELSETAPALKDEYILEAEMSYRLGDWTKAAATCDEVEKKPWFTLTAADKERITLLRLRSQNRLQATALPADTLIVDRFTAASYFHVFGSGGAVDILIRAGSVQELLAQPEFAPAKDRIARGKDDLVLTPSVTKLWGGRDAFQHEFRDSVIWSDPYIAEASQALAAMRTSTVKPGDFDLAILVPKNAKQQAAMGVQWTDAQRDYAWNAAEYFKLAARDAPVITEAANRSGIWGLATDALGTESKKDVIRSLTSKKGVVILFAHGDRDGIYTPEGEKLTVQDVRGLDLHKNQPIVLLLSCEGNAAGASSASSSIAQELKRSGAMAVMSYEQKVDAREAASAGVQFFENMRGGKTPLESFRLTFRSKGIRAGPKLHLKVQLQRLVPADFDACLTGRVSDLFPDDA
jgi:hypothetical protein